MKKLLLFASLLMLTACSNDEQPARKEVQTKSITNNCLTPDCSELENIVVLDDPKAPAVVVKPCRTLSTGRFGSYTAIGTDASGQNWQYTVTYDYVLENRELVLRKISSRGHKTDLPC